jgi:hypothetical protein
LSAGVGGKRVEKNAVEALPAPFRGGKPDFPAGFDKMAPGAVFAVRRLPLCASCVLSP